MYADPAPGQMRNRGIGKNYGITNIVHTHKELRHTLRNRGGIPRNLCLKRIEKKRNPLLQARLAAREAGSPLGGLDTEECFGVRESTPCWMISYMV